MAAELRRSSRYNDFLPITLFVDGDNHQQKLAGPLSGRIVNISNHGACLLMPHVMIDNFHIFHSTREDTSSSLQIKIQNPEDSETMKIAARPVWFNSMKLDDMKVFRIGVDFIDSLGRNDLRKIDKLSKNV